MSYTGADVEVATRIADGLRRAGHEVTIQAVDFRPGSNFVLEMQKGLTTTDHTIAVLSSAYEESGFGSAEWAAAFALDPRGEQRRLIGVRVEDYQPSGLLKAVVYVDLVGRDEDEADALVAQAIESGEPLETVAAEEPSPAKPTANLGPSRSLPDLVPHFVGRQKALDAISDAISSGGRVAITGFGGIGKTSLATAWVQQHHSDFDVVVWLYAPSRQRGAEAIGEVARELDLVDDIADAESAAVALYGYLSLLGQVLVVLDDCPDAETAASLVPENALSILATSRDDRGWSPAGFGQHRLDVLGLDEAVEFLHAAAPEAGNGAGRVADALDGLPLALAQAAAYVDRHAISFDDYLDRLATYAPQVFEQLSGHHYGHTVLSAWALALDGLESGEPAAAWILKLLAFMDPRDFPRGVLVAGVEELPEAIAAVVRDPFMLDAAIASLLRQSLCRLNGDGLSVHPVIQGVVKSRLEPPEAEAVVRTALAILRRSLPDDVELASWPTWERINDHAVTAAADLVRRGIYSVDFVPLVSEVARFSSRRGFPHYANYLLGQIISFLSAHPAEAGWEDAVFAAEELAHSFIELRAADRAEPLFRSLVELAELHGRFQSRGGIAARVGLASALTDTGDHAGGLEQVELAAEAFEGSEDPDPALGAHLYGTWGRLLVRMGARSGGRTRLEQALVLSEEARSDRDIALTHLHLGNTYRDQRGSDRALAHYQRALEAATRIPGGHQAQAEVLVNLSGVAFESGDAAGALGYVETALRALDEVPEGNYSVTAAMLHFQRAQFRSRIGGADLAEVVAEAGLSFEIVCDHLPPRHPHRQQIGVFLLTIAEALGDDSIRSAVWEREPGLGMESES